MINEPNLTAFGTQNFSDAVQEEHFQIRG